MNVHSNEDLGLPQSKGELLDRIEGEWRLLQNVMSTIPPERMQIPSSGGWSVKDVLAHIAEWERYMRLHHLQEIPSHDVLGLEFDVYKTLDEDGLNAILFERNKDRTVGDVTAGLDGSHAQVMRDLGAMSFEEMIGRTATDSREAKPKLVWIAANTYEHYREHREAIEKLTNA